MKILTILIHSEAQQELLDKIRSLKVINGFTFSHAEGHGTHVESDDFLAARETWSAILQGSESIYCWMKHPANRL
ncbi:MAG: DUF3240 family protein [Candidatus Thiodiazotropha sp. (ex Cardiolucina cf. quadrata)]|nr:DUF3240 family protein [Candidatus Thiodiazotropha sp. (ex Cardiolucina cf. quadrata)]